MPAATELLVRFSADTSQVDQAEKKISGLGSRLGTVLGTAGGFVLGSAITNLVGDFGSLVGAGFQFEQGMANVGSVMDMTGQQASQLESLVRQLGSSTAASANEVAAAAENLAKAGVSYEDIMAGALQGAVNLALAAGDVTSDQAGEIIANTLNMFHLAGDQATAVADAFAAGANKSSASVPSLAAALAQGGAAVTMFGGDMYDAIGILSLFDQNALKGSDAGTSLKTMLLSLVAPTKEQTDLMGQLGLSFFDAQGQFIGFSAMAEELKTSLAGMSEGQRNATFKTLFGSDAIRAANILYEQGAEGVNEYTDAVKDQGAAEEVAAKRMDTLMGDIEQFKGALETLSITGTKLVIPMLRGFVQAGTTGINAVTDWVTGFVDGYNRLRNLKPTGVMNKLGIVGPDGALFTSQMGRVTALTTVLAARFKALTGINADQFFRRLGVSILRPYDAAKKLMDSLSAKNWNKGLEGVGDAISSVPKFFGDMLKSISTGIPWLDNLLLDTGKVWTDYGRLVQEAFQLDWDGFNTVLQRTGRNLTEVAGDWIDLGGAVGGKVIDVAMTIGAAAIDAAPDVIGWIGDHLDTVAGWLKSGWDGIVDIGSFLFNGAVDGASDLKGWISANSGTLTGWLKSGWDGLVDIGSFLFNGAVDGANDLKGWISANIGTVGGWLKSGWDGLVDIGSFLFNAAVDGADDLKGWINAHTDTVVSWLKSGWTGIVELGDIAATVGEVTVKGDANGTSLGSKIGNALHDTVSSLPDIATGLSSGVIDAITGFDYVGWFDNAQNTGAAVHDLVAGIGGFVAGAIEDAFTALATDPGSVIKSVGGVAVTAAGAVPAITEFIATSIASFLFGAVTGMDSEDFSLAGFTGELAGKVWDAISGAIGDALDFLKGGKPTFGANGSMDPAAGYSAGTDMSSVISDAIKGLIPDSIPDISLPSFDFKMDSVKTAIDGALAWLTSNIPDWMVAFANGDIKGAIRLLFGGSPNNGLVPAPVWSGDPSDAPPPGGFLPPSAPPSGPGGSQPSSPSSNSATLPDGTVVTTLPAVGTGSSLNQVPPPDFTAFNAAIATIPQLLGQQMDAALQLAATVSTGIGTAVGSIFQGMVDNVSVITGMIPTNVGNAFNTTLGVSVAVANGIYVAVSTAFGMMVGNVSGIVNTLPGIVVGAMNAAASSGAAAAYNAGASIGYGLANGIDSAIGAVSAAADRLAAEAQRAAEARAKIASPSKVFHEIGSQMGEGLVLGLASRYGDAAGAGAGLAGAAIPSGSIAGRNGGGDTYNITIIAPESEEYSQYARDAKRGKALAVNLAQLMRNV